MGLPRGLATALTAIAGFVVMGLVGWFVVWQVMENIDDLSNQIQDGINELKRWLLNSPFHVTEAQINDIAKSLSDAIGANTEAITSAGLEGVTVIVEAAHRHAARDVLHALPALRRQAHLGVDAQAGPARRPVRASPARDHAPGGP